MKRTTSRNTSCEILKLSWPIFSGKKPVQYTITDPFPHFVTKIVRYHSFPASTNNQQMSSFPYKSPIKNSTPWTQKDLTKTNLAPNSCGRDPRFRVRSVCNGFHKAGIRPLRPASHFFFDSTHSVSRHAT